MKCTCYFLLLLFVGLDSLLAADEAAPPTFLRGLNLNGTAVAIDGNLW